MDLTLGYEPRRCSVFEDFSEIDSPDEIIIRFFPMPGVEQTDLLIRRCGIH